MGSFQDHKPVMAMLALQFVYAAMALTARATILGGMSPRIFVVYRNTVATLVLAPIAYISRKSNGASIGLRTIFLIFITSLIGLTVNQNMYIEGLYLTSSSLASAMGNLIPATTFVIAAIVGLENLKFGSLTSIAKIVGTIICVSAAISMVLLRGPKILNAEFHPLTSVIYGSEGKKHLLGCLFLFGSACCWSLWLVLQVPLSASYPDHLSLTAWMCFMGMLQSGTLTFFLEKDLEAWKIRSYFDLASCLFAGAIGSGVAFLVQSWCISKRGPLFSALFNPLVTVLVTILAAIILHEEIYMGSLVGAFGVIIGLYVVLWGKAKEFAFAEIKEEEDLKSGIETTAGADVVEFFTNDEESLDKTSFKLDLEQPLLLSHGSTKKLMF